MKFLGILYVFQRGKMAGFWAKLYPTPWTSSSQCPCHPHKRPQKALKDLKSNSKGPKKAEKTTQEFKR